MRRRVGRPLAWLLIVAAGGGLGVDAYVHLDVASSYRLVRSAYVSQADLFRLEASVAIVVALALVIRPNRLTALIAFLVGAVGVGVVLFYTYVDPGPIGPLPDMYDPVWYPEKVASVIGESVAVVAGAVLAVVPPVRTPRLPR